MWPFRKADTEPTLNARVVELERELKSLRVEWEEWYDKYRRLYARLSKRVDQSHQQDNGGAEGEDLTSAASPGGSAPASANLLGRMRARERGLLR